MYEPFHCMPKEKTLIEKQINPKRLQYDKAKESVITLKMKSLITVCVITAEISFSACKRKRKLKDKMKWEVSKEQALV